MLQHGWNLEDIIRLDKRSQTQRATYVIPFFYEIARKGKSINIESTLVVAGASWGEEIERDC